MGQPESVRVATRSGRTHEPPQPVVRALGVSVKRTDEPRPLTMSSAVGVRLRAPIPPALLPRRTVGPMIGR